MANIPLTMSKGCPAFDDFIVGEHVKVCYTHHEPPDELGNVGEPMFLCFDEHGKSLPMYMIGYSNAIGWIKEVDYRINNRKQQSQ